MNLPWDAHPDLTYSRLAAIAQMIVLGRDAAVVRHDPTIGDDDWVLGCRAFQACRSAILRSAGTEATPWLTIVDPSRHFIFKIGSVPVRFYRGDPEDAGHRTKAQSFPELAQLSLAFPGADVRTLVYRIAVETDIDGRALAVHCVGWDGDSVVLNWPIPLKAVVTVAAVVRDAKPGVDLPAPAVAEKDDDEATNDNDAAREAETDKTAN